MIAGHTHTYIYIQAEAVCELGVFGLYLSDGSYITDSDSGTTAVDSSPKKRSRNVRAGTTAGASAAAPGHAYPSHYGGFILRVKASNVNEGGIAAGYAFASTPALVD